TGRTVELPGAVSGGILSTGSTVRTCAAVPSLPAGVTGTGSVHGGTSAVLVLSPAADADSGSLSLSVSTTPTSTRNELEMSRPALVSRVMGPPLYLFGAREIV